MAMNGSTEYSASFTGDGTARPDSALRYGAGPHVIVRWALYIVYIYLYKYI